MGLPMMLYGAKHIEFILAKIGNVDSRRSNVQLALAVMSVTFVLRLHVPYVAQIVLVVRLWCAIHRPRYHWRSW